MNTLNAFIFAASVLSSATAHANLAEKHQPSRTASPRITSHGFALSGENFIDGSVQNTYGVFSSAGSAVVNDLPMLEKNSVAGLDSGLLSIDGNQEPDASITSFTTMTVPNTLGMLLAGAGMIGFMVATRRNIKQPML